MTTPSSTANWLDPVISMLDRHDRCGAFFVCFPTYRPDLVADMAHRCGLDLFDFRQEVMAALGWNASRISLADLDREIADRTSTGRGLVVQNCESLLALSTPQVRRKWAAGFLESDTSVPVIAPVAVFGDDLPMTDRRVVALDAGQMPEEGLLLRLLGS